MFSSFYAISSGPVEAGLATEGIALDGFAMCFVARMKHFVPCTEESRQKALILEEEHLDSSM